MEMQNAVSSQTAVVAWCSAAAVHLDPTISAVTATGAFALPTSAMTLTLIQTALTALTVRTLT